MFNTTPLSSRFITAAFAVAIIATFALHLRAQDAPAVHVGNTAITGIPDDWTHHRVVFSDPGTEQDAIKNGTHEQWLKIVNNPRYVIQQMKKGLPVQGPAAQDVEMRRRISAQQDGGFGRFGGGPRPGMPGGPRQATSNPIASPLQRDWSMNSGGGSAAITLGIPAASGSITAGTTSLTVNAPGAATITANAPVAASMTGTFTGNPTNGQQVTVGGTALTATISAPASGSISIGSSFCFPQTTGGVTVGATALTTSATAGTGTYSVGTTLPSGGDQVVIGGVTYNFESSLGGATLNQVLIGYNQATTARNLSVGINNTGTCGNTSGGVCTHNIGGVNPEVSSTNANSSSQTITALCADNAQITGTSDGTKVVVGTVAAGNAGSTTGTTFGLGTNAQTALNIITAINANSGTVTAGNGGTGVVSLAADAGGTAGNGYALSDTATSGVTLTAFSGGTNGTNTGTNFANDGVPTDNATNLASAIGRSVATVNATSGGTATVTVTAKTAGTGGNGITLANALGNFGWTGSATTLAGGSDGLSDGTHFSYWTTSAYDTAVQLAASLAASINASSVNTNVTAATGGTSNLTISADAGGTGGNSYTASVASFTGVTGAGPFSGGISGAGQAGQYPAKYSFSTGTISTSNCTSDYIVYPTGGAGSTTQATIVAYNNIYKTTCTSLGSVPSIYWAYNTGGTATLSPVLSYYGDQVAYIQNTGGTAYLVLLKMANSGGTVNSPAAPANFSVTNPNYRSCTAPCYTTLTLGTTDTRSAPFYRYDGSDVLYVGDDHGRLHQFSAVFTGTPVERTGGSPSWPLTVSSNINNYELSSPVYDSGTSGDIYIAENWTTGGTGNRPYLYQVNPSTGTVTPSVQLGASPLGAPILDSSAQKVYAFIGNDYTGNNNCPGGNACSGVYQLTAGSIGSTPVEAYVGTGAGSATTNLLYAGDFDNTYFTTKTGHLYVCGNTSGAPTLYGITITNYTMTGGNATTGPALTSSGTPTCSPITEIYNGTNDWLFMSVTTGGKAVSGCTPAGAGCVYSFDVHAGVPGTGTSASAGLNAAGGSGGIIIDNLSPSGTTGGSEVYYTPLASQTCAGNGTTGSGTGACAVQATQSALQ